jgi:hypothetical protein
MAALLFRFRCRGALPASGTAPGRLAKHGLPQGADQERPGEPDNSDGGRQLHAHIIQVC